MFLGGIYAEARLAAPSISVKLSDVIAGITLLGAGYPEKSVQVTQKSLCGYTEKSVQVAQKSR
jgi:hypothetical protein